MAVSSAQLNAQSSSSSSWVHTAPAGLQTGDVVVAIVRLDTTSDLLSSISTEGGSSWTSWHNNGSYARTYVRTQIVGSSAPSTYTVSLSSAATGNTIFVRLTAVDESSVVMGDVEFDTTSGPFPGPISLSPGIVRDYLDILAFGGSGNTVSAYPSGYPAINNEVGPSGTQSAISAQEASSSPSSSNAWTISSSADWKAFLLAIETIVAGSGSPVEGADTSTASGLAYTPITGSGSPTEATDTSIASGMAYTYVSGSAAPIEEADTSSASGSVFLGISGSGSPTEGADTSSAAGTAFTAVTGSGSPTEAADTSMASGNVGGDIDGMGSPVEAADTSSASGTAYSGITGSAALDEAADSPYSSGAVTGGGPKHCCCPGGCEGCCFPFETYDFGPPWGVGRNLLILKWEVVAPNCPEIDGWTGEFSPETTGPHDEFGGCGNCLCYQNATLDPYPDISGSVWFENDLGECVQTPCNFTMCLGLTCDSNDRIHQSTPSIQRCCSAIKLLVHLFGWDATAGGNALNLSGECFDELAPGGKPTWPGCPVDTFNLALYLDPISCTCPDPDDPDDTMGNFEVIYDLEEIAAVCPSENVHPPGHACEGLPTCCIMSSCSFDDAYVIVTKKP